MLIEEGFSCVHAAIDGQCSKDILQALIDHGAHIDATRKDGTNALFRACTTGQSESVRFLVEAGTDVSIITPDGNTCLHIAVHGGCSKEALQKIIEQGVVNVNSVNNEGLTALLLACFAKQSESAKYLLESGADPNISDARGNTHLHAAVQRYRCCTNQILQEMIAHEAHLDAQNTDGETALWVACSLRQQNFAKILLEAGSNPNIASSDRDTSLHAAVSGGCSKNIISAILDHGADVNATNNNNLTALMIACERGKKVAINVLLDAGADPNIASSDRDTSLHAAVSGGCSKNIISALLEHGADVNATNKKNVTALMIACKKGKKDAINVLLNSGADPNITDADGDTCLYYIYAERYHLHNEHTEILQAIISHGVDVNATNKKNVTALMIACKKGKKDAINVLLNSGADPNITEADGDAWPHYASNESFKYYDFKGVLQVTSKGIDVNADAGGDTCLHYAARNEQWSTEVLQTIISHGVDVNTTNKKSVTALMIACANGNKDAINVLLDAGADTNIADADGDTWLHNAARSYCFTEVLQTILSQGVDVNATNKKNVTALMIACEKGNKDAINVLLNAGADPNLADADGDTWLHYAARKFSRTDGHTEVLQAIISPGIDVNTANKRNVTSLMIACKEGEKDAINVLLNAGADPNIADDNGDTCLHNAAGSYCYTAIVLQAIISHGADVNATNEENVTALMIACKKTKKDEINVLLNAAADPNITDPNGDTCLHYAARQLFGVKVFRIILNQGVNVNATNTKNVTALMIVCEKGEKGAINILLNAGADPNIADANGDTCLHYISAKENLRHNEHTEILHAIIKHGVDVNARSKKNVTVLMIACKKRKKDAINVLLNAGADLNIADADGDTCLHNAVGNLLYTDGHTEVLQGIISHGIDVNATNKKNMTALMIACAKENKDAINILLNAGADPNIADSDGDTCLHYAARSYWLTEVLQAIISHGVDVNATDKKNVNALMLACKIMKQDAINVLLNAGADPNIADADGDTCLHYAARSQWSTQVFQAILSQGVDVNATNKKNVTALMLACEEGEKDAINVLLNAGADLNIADAGGDICLHYAARRYWSTEGFQAIISHGVDVNATNKKNENALMLACKNKKKDVINVLLNAGADPNIVDVDGDTCLHNAARSYCSTEVLQAIISHGIDVNATNKKNVTALMIACEEGKKDAINVLLNAGADPNIADVDGDTCLHNAARSYCSTEVLQAIISHGGDVNATNKKNENALMLACKNKKEDVINVLLNAGTDLNIADADGDTCLHNAARSYCSTEVLQAIISHGVDVNATNKKNENALILACKNKKEDVINVLLDAGADPNIADADGDTYLHYAARGYWSTEVLQAILSQGVDVNATNKKNVTALMIACEKGEKDVINVLLNAGADTNIADGDGDTCLHFAAQTDCSTEVLQAILSHGVDVNATNKKNVTALMIACEKGKKDAINVLLNAGADPNIADADGDTCFHNAARRYCSTEVLQAIISHGVDVNATNKKNVNTLMLVCENMKEDAINVLLNAGADPNITDADGNTWLHYAARMLWFRNRHTKVLQVIISHGVDVNATNKKNVTALMSSCERGKKDDVKVLLNAGADPNITDADGNTCLHYAAQNYRCTRVLQAIISQGVDVNATNNKSVTALMIACEKGKQNAINVLLNAGADPNIADADGNTCLHYAAQNHWYTRVLQAIISQGVDVNATNKKSVTALMIACEKGKKNAINVLLNAGADLNIADADGDTCLHYAARSHWPKEIFHSIISHGFDVNATNKTHVTALMIVCKKGYKNDINVLLNAGADPNIADANGDTWLHNAAQNHRWTEVLHSIISHGVDVNAVNKSNATALMTACQRGNTYILNALLNAGADPYIVKIFCETCDHYAPYGESSINLQTHPDLNVIYIKKKSASGSVCQKPRLLAMSVLISQTDTNIADTNGDSLLYNPVNNHISKELLQTVTDLGAELHVLKDKSAPAQNVAHSNQGQTESINILLKAGADTTIVDVFGDTCLHKILHREYLSLEYDHEALQMLVVLCARIGGFVATRFHPIKHCRSSIRAIL